MLRTGDIRQPALIKRQRHKRLIVEEILSDSQAQVMLKNANPVSQGLMTVRGRKQMPLDSVTGVTSHRTAATRGCDLQRKRPAVQDIT